MTRDSAKSTGWSFREEAQAVAPQVPLPANQARIALGHAAVGKTLRALAVAGLPQTRTKKRMKVWSSVLLRSRTIKTQ